MAIPAKRERAEFQQIDPKDYFQDEGCYINKGTPIRIRTPIDYIIYTLKASTMRKLPGFGLWCNEWVRFFRRTVMFTEWLFFGKGLIVSISLFSNSLA